MTKFIEVVSRRGATHLIPIDKILSVIEYDGKTTIYIEPNGQCTPKNTYQEIKEMIFKAFLEIDGIKKRDKEVTGFELMRVIDEMEL